MINCLTLINLSDIYFLSILNNNYFKAIWISTIENEIKLKTKNDFVINWTMSVMFSFLLSKSAIKLVYLVLIRYILLQEICFLPYILLYYLY